MLVRGMQTKGLVNQPWEKKLFSVQQTAHEPVWKMSTLCHHIFKAHAYNLSDITGRWDRSPVSVGL